MEISPKNYQITFSKKQSFLGIPKAKKWIFLANYIDRTLIRNAVALEIARNSQFEWTSSGKFTDVFLNGKFLGNYYICEKIQINTNRLNISPNAFLLEFDTHYDETYKFKTALKKFPVNIKNPDNLSNKQLNYIQSNLDSIEDFLYTTNNTQGIEKYLDLQTFAKYFIVYELTQNGEPNHPKSFFMYKDNGPLKAGPVWDFDWSTFNNQKKRMAKRKRFMV